MRILLPMLLILAGCERQTAAPKGVDAEIVDTGAVAQPKAGYKAAPTGDAALIAAQAIRTAGHPCPRVVSASRLSDGSIAAVCDNREDYRITRIDALGTVAMRCSAVRRMGIKGC